MEAVENPVLEPRGDRIARCKAERRRERAERYVNVEELRREEVEGQNPESRAHAGPAGSGGERVNGRKGGVPNGEVEAPTQARSSGR